MNIGSYLVIFTGEKKMRNVMLDLETMGTSSNSAIIAIGAVEFDFTSQVIGSRFYTTIDLESAMAAGGVVDASTVLWWMHQSETARAEFKRPGLPVVKALKKFSNWLHTCASPDEVRVWGNGASFDNVILASAYDRLKTNRPWQFYNDRCYRTVKNQRPDVKLLRVGTHHNAVDDAESQARHLLNVVTALKNVLSEDA